jgi:hypothetical protein
MALVFTPDKSGGGASPIAIAGGVWLLFGTLTFSGSYATGGDGVDLARFIPQLSTLRQVVPIPAGLRGNGAEFDVVNKKLKLYPTANTEHAAAAYNAALTASPVPVAFLCK